MQQPPYLVPFPGMVPVAVQGGCNPHVYGNPGPLVYTNVPAPPVDMYASYTVNSAVNTGCNEHCSTSCNTGGAIDGVPYKSYIETVKARLGDIITCTEQKQIENLAYLDAEVAYLRTNLQQLVKLQRAVKSLVPLDLRPNQVQEGENWQPRANKIKAQPVQRPPKQRQQRGPRNSNPKGTSSLPQQRSPGQVSEKTSYLPIGAFTTAEAKSIMETSGVISADGERVVLPRNLARRVIAIAKSKRDEGGSARPVVNKRATVENSARKAVGTSKPKVSESSQPPSKNNIAVVKNSAVVKTPTNCISSAAGKQSTAISWSDECCGGLGRKFCFARGGQQFTPEVKVRVACSGLVPSVPESSKIDVNGMSVRKDVTKLTEGLQIDETLRTYVCDTVAAAAMNVHEEPLTCFTVDTGKLTGEELRKGVFKSVLNILLYEFNWTDLDALAAAERYVCENCDCDVADTRPWLIDYLFGSSVNDV